MKKVSVPSGLWHDNSELQLSFPDSWDLDVLNSPGLDKPALGSDQIKFHVENPIDGPTLEELCAGKTKVAIVFDDMTRPTPVKDIAPYVLGILHKAGMKKEQIRFIWALGSHGAYDMVQARKKLGRHIVENYAVYNHDPFQNVVRAGRTPTGVEVWYNQEFMSCDLKIGIGCITPHVHAGFGGGAKLIMPGIAGIETINQFHNQLFRDQSRTGLGNFENNIMRGECDAAGDLAGLNFKIDCLINRRGQITDLYSGTFRATHATGAREGKDHYGITCSAGYDIVVCNSYAKASESAIALLLALQTLKPSQGTAVLISVSPEGQVPHYVMRAWGTDYGGRHYNLRSPGYIRIFMKKLIVMNPYPDRTCLDLVCDQGDAVIVKTWDRVIELLKEEYPENAKVAVIPDGTMQYIRCG